MLISKSDHDLINNYYETLAWRERRGRLNVRRVAFVFLLVSALAALGLIGCGSAEEEVKQAFSDQATAFSDDAGKVATQCFDAGHYCQQVNQFCDNVPTYGPCPDAINRCVEWTKFCKDPFNYQPPEDSSEEPLPTPTPQPQGDPPGQEPYHL